MMVGIVAAVVAIGDGAPAWARGGWTPTPSMASSHVGGTATLLADGDVLVAGGFDNGEVATSELYDPATNTWTTTGSLNTARHYATATLLPSGKVLLAGGYGASGALASAEIYDPATRTWTPTGSMPTAHASAAATLLDDGKVLVAGGDRGAAATSSNAELYDPTTGTWTAAGSMTAARDDLTATLLPSGKVLVAGGFAATPSFQIFSSAELYDPATSTWSATGSMSTARTDGTATALDDGDVLLAGGTDRSGILSSAERYHPASGTWTAAGTMTEPRYHQVAVGLRDGRVLVAGGENTGGALSSADLFDPATDSWTATQPMGSPRSQAIAAPLDDGRVLVAGGVDNGRLTSAEVWTPTTTRTANDVDFGTLTVGQSATRDVTVHDTGGDPLWIDGAQIAGDDAHDFSIAADDCSHRTLAPGAFCAISVQFTPSATGSRNARLELDDNAGPGAASALTGVGIGIQSAPPPTATQTTPTVPPPHVCASRRRFTVHVKAPPGGHLRSGTVSLNGKRIARVTRRRHNVVVDLRGKPAGTYTLRIRITTKTGRHLTIVRRYRTCVPAAR